MGFFYHNKMKNKGASKKALPVETLNNNECKTCPNNRKKDRQVHFEPTGSETPDVYFLGASPTEDAVENEAHFADEYGEFLLDCIPGRYHDQVAFGYSIQCITAGQDPTQVETECCRKRVEADIAKCKPKIVVGVGHIPLRFIVDHYGIVNWRGRRVPVSIGGHKCWYYSILAPDFVIKKRRRRGRGGAPQEGELDHIFRLDLRRLFWELKEGLPEPVIEDPSKYYSNLTIIDGSGGQRDLDKLEKALRSLEDEKDLGIDIETVNLRPYKDKSRILTIAVGTYENTVAFPLEHPGGWKTKRFREEAWDLLYDFLLHSGTKIAHNLEFEQEWLSYYLGNEVLRGTKWGDTMAQVYLMDNRKQMHSLEVATLVYLGFNLKAIMGHTMDMAHLDLEPIDRVLRYNALDTKYTHRLFKTLQQPMTKRELDWSYDHLIRLSPTLVLAQQAGIRPNQEKLAHYQTDLSAKLTDVTARIHLTNEAKRYKRVTGKTLVPSGNKELERLFGEILGRPEGKKAGGKYGTDEDILKSMPADEVPLAPLILEYRNYAKTLSTYVDGILKITDPDGLIHTNYSSKYTATGRLSSSNPNTQNFPKRKNKHVRTVIGAPEGGWIVSADYGQIEARVLGMLSEDQNFCDALWNDYDVHLEWSKICAEAHDGGLWAQIRDENPDADEAKHLKIYRGTIKNGLVFPWFYGASMYSVAKVLGIPDDKMKKLYDKFWLTFAGVKKWQDTLVSFYEKHGYVKTATGRRRWGPLTLNELINMPIQGTASDIVTNGMCQLSELELVSGRDIAKTQARLNIHDDLTFYIMDDILDETIDVIAKGMCFSPLETFDFINVPISIEVEIGRDWGTQKEYGVYNSTEWGHTR